MTKQIRKKIAFGIAVGFLAVAGGICQSGKRPDTWARPVASQYLKNWYQVDENVYRSSQPDRKGFEEVAKKGIRTILNLRSAHSDTALVSGLGFLVVEVPMTAVGFKEEDIVKALRAIQSAPKPMLIHCQLGSDRAGVVVAMYRIIFEGWPKQDALDELVNGGFGFHNFWYPNIPAFIKNVDVMKIKRLLNLPLDLPIPLPIR